MAGSRSCLALVLIGIVVSGCSYSKEQQQEMQRIRDMVSVDPGSINRPGTAGNTPLQLAVINNYLPLIDWLKDHGADPNSRGLHGDTPFRERQSSFSSFSTKEQTGICATTET